MRAYHRFDIGVDFIKKKRKYTRIWNISFYNLYNRNNPFFLDIATEFTRDGTTGQLDNKRVLKQISLFPVIPSFSYRIEF